MSRTRSPNHSTSGIVWWTTAHCADCFWASNVRSASRDGAGQPVYDSDSAASPWSAHLPTTATASDGCPGTSRCATEWPCQKLAKRAPNVPVEWSEEHGSPATTSTSESEPARCNPIPPCITLETHCPSLWLSSLSLVPFAMTLCSDVWFRKRGPRKVAASSAASGCRHRSTPALSPSLAR